MDETKVPKQWREWWNERVALIHFDGGLPRDEAEQEALACLRAHVAEFQARQRRKAGRTKP